MKIYISKHHILTTICSVPYLLPFGQGIVDRKRQLMLNPSAAALWSVIEEGVPDEGIERSALAALLCENNMPEEDAYDFIDSLIDAKALTI